MSYLKAIKSNLSFLTSSKIKPEELERRAFTFRGQVMSNKVQINQELARIYSIFAHDVELDDSNKRYYFTIFLDELDAMCDGIDYSNEKEILAVKKVMVYLEMELGIKLSFYNVFNEMIKYQEFYDIDYDTERVSCGDMFTIFYDRLIERQVTKDLNGKERYIDNIFNNCFLKIDNLLNSYDLSNIGLKYKRLMNDLVAFTSNKDLNEDDILFVQCVLSFCELKLDSDITFTSGLEYLDNHVELFDDFKMIFNESVISLESLYASFNKGKKVRR